MVRSINIKKTDQLVCDTIKSVLQQIRDLSHMACDRIDPLHQNLDDRNGLLTDGITWMSPEQIDLLSDEEKKVVVGNMITSIKASFDNVTKKHRLDIEFADTVSRIFDNDSEDRRTLADSGNLACRVSGGLGEYPEPELRSDAGKKSGGSRIKSAAERNYSVTVE